MAVDTMAQYLNPDPVVLRATSINKSPPREPERQTIAGEALNQTQNLPLVATEHNEFKVVVSQLNYFIHDLRRDVRFSIEEAIDSSAVLVVDAESGELLRKISREDILAVSRLLGESLKGTRFSSDNFKP